LKNTVKTSKRFINVGDKDHHFIKEYLRSIGRFNVYKTANSILPYIPLRRGSLTKG